MEHSDPVALTLTPPTGLRDDAFVCLLVLLRFVCLFCFFITEGRDDLSSNPCTLNGFESNYVFITINVMMRQF